MFTFTFIFFSVQNHKNATTLGMIIEVYDTKTSVKADEKKKKEIQKNYKC